MPGRLFLVATPLGNAGDLSPRAVSTLRDVDILYAEDTRTATGVLATVGIRRSVLSCHDHNENLRAGELAQHLAAEKSVGLMSEAGTPAISDPGYRLVQAAIAAGALVSVIPGPSAVVTALVASGLPTERFFFGGFLSRKPGARRAALQSVASLDATLIFYESPMRVAKTLADCLAILGDRPACVARELTKTHEEFVRDHLSGLVRRYAEKRPLGEITLVIAGIQPGVPDKAADAQRLKARAVALLAKGHSARDVTQILTEESALPRKTVYALVLAAAAAQGT